MGTTARISPSAVADALFTPVQQRVLGLLFGQPDREFGTSELIRLVGAGTGATHRVVRRLATAGLLAQRSSGNQIYYRANPASPVFVSLVDLIQKTSGLAERLRVALAPLGTQIRRAFVFGSVADKRDHATSDIDLLVVSDQLDYESLYTCLREAEMDLGRQVNPVLLTSAEWNSGLASDTGLVASVRRGATLSVIGEE